MPEGDPHRFQLACGTIIATILSLFTAFVANGQKSDSVLVGTVTKVVDGDTIDVQLSSGPIRVRLHGRRHA